MTLLLNSLQWLPADHWIKYELLSLAFGLSTAWPRNILLISSLLLPYLNFMTWCFSTGPCLPALGFLCCCSFCWTIGHSHHVPASVEISLFQKVFPVGSLPTPITRGYDHSPSKLAQKFIPYSSSYLVWWLLCIQLSLYVCIRDFKGRKYFTHLCKLWHLE